VLVTAGSILASLVPLEIAAAGLLWPAPSDWRSRDALRASLLAEDADPSDPPRARVIAVDAMKQPQQLLALTR
jgi:hypothetical protein